MASSKFFLSKEWPRLDPHKLKLIVSQALREDIGKGDITTQLTIPKNKTVSAVILAKEDCIICGLEIAKLAFKITDKSINFTACCRDGQKIKKNMVIARISGKACSILTAERVALNFLSLLSAISTKTQEYVQLVRPYNVKILDTRKTIPGLRLLQKYAVRAGGGYNHRMGLDEMILVKDNHLQIAGSLNRFSKSPRGIKVEIEAQNINELKHALRFKPDIIMLDNMPIQDIKKAVRICAGKGMLLETSGRVNLKTVRKIASTGVNFISIGALTHSIDSIDMSLDIL